jgi:cysteine desulfurase/selenocysteine lyase
MPRRPCLYAMSSAPTQLDSARLPELGQSAPSELVALPRGRALLDKVAAEFIGSDTCHTLADGSVRRRRYLDSAASTLMLKVVNDAVSDYLPHYASSHSQTHFGARLAGDCLAWARQRVLRFVDAPDAEYACLFVGAGATAALNKAARLLRAARPESQLVLVSGMEHHSNDLPHRKAFPGALHVGVAVHGDGALGAIDLERLRDLLCQHAGRVAYVAITLASNVTGILNPIAEITRLAHEHGAWVLLDAAQALPRVPLSLRALLRDGGVDALAFSGHKAYAPGSPGVLVLRRTLLQGLSPDEVGGGMAAEVYRDMFVPHAELPAREEPGTPNIVGAVALASALEVLSQIGMDVVREHEAELTQQLLRGLARVPGSVVYGDTNLTRTPRVGVVSFNLRGLDHGFVAAVLNDYHNLALRSGCFCAHPYVRDLLQRDIWALELDDERAIKRRLGMARASFGLYSTHTDVNRLIEALDGLSRDPQRFLREYKVTAHDTYEHLTFRFGSDDTFNPEQSVQRALRETWP